MSRQPASSLEGSESSCRSEPAAGGIGGGQWEPCRWRITAISASGECEKQISHQTEPQIARIWVSSGPESWLSYSRPLYARLPGLMAECGFSTCASCVPLFTWDAFAPSFASRQSPHLSRSSSDVTFSGKPSWISSRQRSHPCSGFCREAEFPVSGMPWPPLAQSDRTKARAPCSHGLANTPGCLQQPHTQPCTQWARTVYKHANV